MEQLTVAVLLTHLFAGAVFVAYIFTLRSATMHEPSGGNTFTWPDSVDGKFNFAAHPSLMTLAFSVFGANR